MGTRFGIGKFFPSASLFQLESRLAGTHMYSTYTGSFSPLVYARPDASGGVLFFFTVSDAPNFPQKLEREEGGGGKWNGTRED